MAWNRSADNIGNPRGGRYCNGQKGHREIKVYSDNIGVHPPLQPGGTRNRLTWQRRCANLARYEYWYHYQPGGPAGAGPGTVLALSACGGGGSSSGGGVDTVSQGAPAAPAVSWYSTAKPLLERYCVSCHSTDSAAAPFPLETYKQVLGKRSALVYVLESGTMPPVGYADLGAADSAVLLDWLNNGAPEGDPSQEPLRQVAGGYTYHGDARAIIEEKCVNCHEEGGIAPFPLDSYERVRAVSAAAAFAVENGSMPPWHPTEGYTAFAGSRALSPEQKYVLLNWLQGDLAEGDPANYEAPPQKDGKQASDYNLRLPLPQAYTPTLRPDDHRCFAIEWPLDEFAYVTNVDVVPDQLDEVHHVIVSIAEPGGCGHLLRCRW